MVLAMGQPVTVKEIPSSKPGVVRFETNRSFTGMGHERYVEGDIIDRNRPADAIASRLFATGQVARIQIYKHLITVELKPGGNTDGFKDIIENLYTYYLPGVRVPRASDFA